MKKTAAKRKVTPAQQAVLDEIAEKGSFSCIDSYKPAVALIALGLVVVKHTSSTGRLTLVRPE